MPSWNRLFKPKQSTPPLSPLDSVLSVLLETWAQRYQFVFNRERGELVFSRPDFELQASESPQRGIWLAFTEAGKQHRVECSVVEAPKVIKALLFPEA